MSKTKKIYIRDLHPLDDEAIAYLKKLIEDSKEAVILYGDEVDFYVFSKFELKKKANDD